MSKKILLTGGLGQIGSELTEALIKKYGAKNVVVTDTKQPATPLACEFETLNVMDVAACETMIKKHKPVMVYHLAALLSVTGERDPFFTWNLNIGSVVTMLELARKYNYRIFVPSSIAAFGTSTPRDNTPQDTVQRPGTMYGVTKVAGELLAEYYWKKFGVDCRGIRYPGIISYKTEPGGGTTDYAVDIFYKAVKGETFVCPLPEDAHLDMMYMDDAIEATLKLMDAPSKKLIHRNAFNITCFSASPRKFIDAINRVHPELKLKSKFKVDDLKKSIAASWPALMDDTAARQEWGHNPKYNIDETVKIMVQKLKEKFGK